MSFACIETILPFSLLLSPSSSYRRYKLTLIRDTHVSAVRLARLRANVLRRAGTVDPSFDSLRRFVHPSFPYLSPKTIPSQLRPLRQDRAQDLTLTGNYR
jgi:hypothetical protein